MVECKVCEQNMRDLSYTCNYCNQKFCVDHRLPEKHSCVGLLKFDNTEAWFSAEDDTDKSEFVEQIQDIRKAVGQNQSQSESSPKQPDDETTAEAHNPSNLSQSSVDRTDKIQSRRKTIESSDHGPDSSYETVELGSLPGKTVEPDYAASPDVNPDGSVAGSQKTEDHGTEEDTDQNSRWLIVLLAIVLIAAVLWFWMF